MSSKQTSLDLTVPAHFKMRQNIIKFFSEVGIDNIFSMPQSFGHTIADRFMAQWIWSKADQSITIEVMLNGNKDSVSAWHTINTHNKSQKFQVAGVGKYKDAVTLRNYMIVLYASSL